MEASRRADAVLLTAGAARDLEALHDHIAAVDGAPRALQVLERLQKAIHSLAQQPARGIFPRELAALGIGEFRQVMVAPWRLVYRVEAARVHVLLIADGRRDMQSLLAKRLLEPHGPGNR